MECTWRYWKEILLMSHKLQHYLNPLHVYCRMRDMGIAKETARYLCRIYERAIFRPFLGKRASWRGGRRYNVLYRYVCFTDNLIFSCTLPCKSCDRITGSGSVALTGTIQGYYSKDHRAQIFFMFTLSWFIRLIIDDDEVSKGAVVAFWDFSEFNPHPGQTVRLMIFSFPVPQDLTFDLQGDCYIRKL